MKVVDNFLPKAYMDFLEELFLSPMFPWYLNDKTVEYDVYKTQNTVESPQFTHAFIRDGIQVSDNFNSISVLLYHLMLTQDIRADKPIKVKANLNTANPKAILDSQYIVHTDIPGTKKDEFITCIYYVNDCDGDTVMFDKNGEKEINRVSPKKGRLVYFDSTIPHAGQPPRNSYARCVLNINLATEG